MSSPTASLRSARPDPTPALLITALALGLAVQLALPSPAPVVAVGTARLGARTGASSADLTVSIPAYPAILQRPLFVAGRSLGSDGSGAQAAPAGAFALLGVAASQGRASAVLRDAAGLVRAVGLGGAIDGWRLAQVDGDEATLSRGAERQVLRVGAPPAAAGAPSPASSLGSNPQAGPR